MLQRYEDFLKLPNIFAIFFEKTSLIINQSFFVHSWTLHGDSCSKIRLNEATVKLFHTPGISATPIPFSAPAYPENLSGLREFSLWPERKKRTVLAPFPKG
jgi:hypothetical protein